MPVLPESLNQKKKSFVVDQKKLDIAQRLLRTKSESETIETALEIAIVEAKRNELAWKAHEEFFTNGRKIDAEILDVFGRLESH